MENNLTQKRITDTDIICPLLTQGSVYELVYGTLYHSICENDEVIYNLVVTLCLNQKVKPLQRIYSKKCLTVLNEIINKIDILNKQYDDVRVVIPFIGYDSSLVDTRLHFEFVADILKDFIENDFSEITLTDLDCKEILGHEFYPIPSMDDFLEQYENEMYSTLVELFHYDDTRCIRDERVRRGLLSIAEASPDFEKDLYKEELILDDNPIGKIDEKEDLDEIINLSARISAKKQIGVLYYMLYKQVDMELLVKVANFITNKPYNKEQLANNTAYKYIHNPSIFNEKFEIIEYIKSQLERYDIEVPKELK